MGNQKKKLTKKEKHLLFFFANSSFFLVREKAIRKKTLVSCRKGQICSKKTKIFHHFSLLDFLGGSVRNGFFQKKKCSQNPLFWIAHPKKVFFTSHKQIFGCFFSHVDPVGFVFLILLLCSWLWPTRRRQASICPRKLRGTSSFLSWF